MVDEFLEYLRSRKDHDLVTIEEFPSGIGEATSDGTAHDIANSHAQRGSNEIPSGIRIGMLDVVE